MRRRDPCRCCRGGRAVQRAPMGWANSTGSLRSCPKFSFHPIAIVATVTQRSTLPCQFGPVMHCTQENELNLDPDVAIARLFAIPEYVDLFAAAFPDDPRVTLDNLAAALASFQRTFISDRSLYDAYLKGHLGTLDGSSSRGCSGLRDGLPRLPCAASIRVGILRRSKRTWRRRD